MSERFKKLIKTSCVLAIVVFAICWFVKKPYSFWDYLSCLGYSISVVTIASLIFEKWLWRIIPWDRPPILHKKYTGTIKYIEKQEEKIKKICFEIKQTWTNIDIKIKTDLNSGFSMFAEIVNENNENVLEFLYVTGFSAISKTENQIQFGTCRIILKDDNSQISGKFRTYKQTEGDVFLKAETE